MKPLLALLAVGAAIGLAAPVWADPDPATSGDADNGQFLTSLRAAGITFNNPDQAIAAGKTLCELANRGEPGLELLSDLKANNPGLTTDRAVQFAAIAARSFCPHHLNQKDGGSA